jgi:hypothetical protein
LRDVVRAVQIELKKKLEDLRKQLAASRERLKPQPLPDLPMLYLHARSEHDAAWREIRDELSSRAYVWPAALPPPIDDDALEEKQRAERRKHWAECSGVVLLRAHPDDKLQLEVMAAIRDLQWVHQAKRRRIPWAIVDRVGGQLPVPPNFPARRITTTDPHWADELIRALRHDAGAAP